ncbi:MAG: carboxypeptidase-like regulatory domain-containing protein, partial [Syntrophothermus sp.]
MFLKKLIIFFISGLFLLSGKAMFAQVNVSGMVKDAATGKILPGANIALENSFLSAFSGEDGTFLLKNVSKGENNLRVSFVGYETSRIELNLRKDTVIEIILKAAALLGEEVNIVATRAQPRTPATFSNISSKKIAEINLGRDMPYILQSTPSVLVTSDAGTGVGYTGITIRGTDLTRINVTMNGIPVNDPESQGVWFVDLPDLASSSGNIQVQRGVGTSTNGAGAFGASINIQTQTLNQDPYAELNSSAGSYSTFKNTLKFGTGIMKNHFAFDGRASYITSEGYIDRAFARLGSWHLSGGYFGKNTTIKANILSGTEKTYQA